MSTSTALAAVTSSLTDFGTAVLTIITAVLVIGVGYLVYRVGWRHVKRSLH